MPSEFLVFGFNSAKMLAEPDELFLQSKRSLERFAEVADVTSHFGSSEVVAFHLTLRVSSK